MAHVPWVLTHSPWVLTLFPWREGRRGPARHACQAAQAPAAAAADHGCTLLGDAFRALLADESAFLEEYHTAHGEYHGPRDAPRPCAMPPWQRPPGRDDDAAAARQLSCTTVVMAPWTQHTRFEERMRYASVTGEWLERTWWASCHCNQSSQSHRLGSTSTAPAGFAKIRHREPAALVTRRRYSTFALRRSGLDLAIEVVFSPRPGGQSHRIAGLNLGEIGWSS
eukprot:gene17507-biopygen4697